MRSWWNESLVFVASLKECAKKKDLYEGTRLHAHIRTTGLLANNAHLGNTLISMYAKCGALSTAHEVFRELPLRNVCTWNALLSGYALHGLGKELLDCFYQMKNDRLSPDSFTYACTLKACAIIKDVDLGTQIHDAIVSQGLFVKDVALGNAVVDMYAKCGLLHKAQEVLHNLPVRDVVSWTALLVGYAQQGQIKKAMDCYDQMRGDGLSPSAVTYACILKACGIVKQLDKGKQIHEEITCQGLLTEKDVVLGSALVDMYAKCGMLAKARQVLDELPVRNAVSWNALIAGYAQQDDSENAMACYDQMRHDNISPNRLTYASILKAYGIAKKVDKGKQIHEEIASQGLLGENAVLGNALIDMYAKCGVFNKARQVLDELPVRDTISWSTLIAGYAQQGQGKEAIECYEEMGQEGISPNSVTYICMFKAYGIAKELDKGKQIHEEVATQGLLGKDVVLGNALVDMYAKCGLLTKARHVLDELPVREVVSWNPVIAGYAQQEECEKTMACYDQMRHEGVSPNAITYTCILRACASAKDIDKGRQIHEEIASQGLLGRSAVLGNALVDMYAKCGALKNARQVLEELPVRDIISWSTLMAGYAQEGRGEEAEDCFERMQSEGLVPNAVSWNTLIGGFIQQGESGKALECFHWMQQKGISPDATTLAYVLNACSYAGLLEGGQTLFENMEEKFGILPDIDHHACMVNLLGHTGHFDEAMAVIEKLQPCNHLAVWSALLGACQKWGNVKLGRLAFHHVVQIEERDAAAYVCMENIYAAAGMGEEAQEILSMRVKNATGSCAIWAGLMM